MPTFGPGVGNVITATTTGDYNTIQALVAKVLGAPTDSAPRYGYNQILASSQASTGSKVTLAQWTNLRSDMVRARGHQTGSASEGNNITLPTTSSLITEALRAEYLEYANTLTTYRDTVASNQYTVETINSAVRTSAWNGNIYSTVSLNFGDVPTVRAFFNAGGLVKCAASLTGSFGAASIVKDNTWATMLSQSGTITMTGTSSYLNQGSSGTVSSAIGFFNLGGSFQTIFVKGAPSGAYSANEFRILARVANSVLEIQYQYNDISGQPNAPWGTDEAVDGVISQTTVLWRPTGSYVSINQPGLTLAGDLQNGSTSVYGLTADKYTVDEGSTVTVTLKTQNVSDGTAVTYTVTGQPQSRFSGGTTSGYFTVYGGQAQATWTPANNLFTDGATSFSVVLSNGLASTTININDTSLTPGGTASFTGVGNHQWVAPPGVRTISVLLVAGGGGGGSFSGGGGGGGQVRIFNTTTSPGQTYYLNVGGGGAGGGQGQNSDFSGNIAYAGNGGVTGSSTGHAGTHNGGNGGASGANNGGGTSSGNTGTNMQAAGGGGGGNSQAGQNAPGVGDGGRGGTGTAISFAGQATRYLGGGGGGGGTTTAGTGLYGGGVGGTSGNGSDATANTGGGGGGGGATASGATLIAVLVGKSGGAGGSGQVVIAWP